MNTFKVIEGYPNYSIDMEGNVQNNKTSRILTPYLFSGYLQVKLYNTEGKRKHCNIHRLLAITFIPNDDISKNVIDHIDRNRTNNNILNLRWCTHSENCKNKDYYSHKKSENHHIYKYKYTNLYVVSITNTICIRKSFKTLEEAISFRDEYIKNNPK